MEDPRQRLRDLLRPPPGTEVRQRIADFVTQERDPRSAFDPPVPAPSLASRVVDFLPERFREPVRSAGRAFEESPAGSALRMVASRDPSELLADAAGGPIVGGGRRAAQAARAARAARQTVANPVREAFPKIYDNPTEIISRANALVSPESKNLNRIFGTTREELASVASERMNPRYLPESVSTSGSGAAHASQVMNRRNTARLRNVLEAGQERAPELIRGMSGWYNMEPAYLRLVELVGPEEATKRFLRLQALTGMSSSGSNVVTELRRGSVANALAQTNEFDIFKQYGGLPRGARPQNMRERFPNLPGHPYHESHTKAMERFLESGQVQMSGPKVPAYIQASLPQYLGGQSSTLVGDAHWARGVGLADVRPSSKGFKDSISNSELASLRNWWRDRVARQVGMEPVPAQANLWGLMAPSTGVKTKIAAPKLELYANEIVRAAAKQGVSPETMRDAVLLGDKALVGLALPALFTGGAVANQQKKREDR